MFRIFFFVIAIAFACAKDWVHYIAKHDTRDVAHTENGTLWAAFAWGLQEYRTNKTEKVYMPGSNNLATADFVQLFALPGDDIIAVSRNGILVRKNKNSESFEIINNAFVERKRAFLQGLGKMAENILIMPLEGAIAFFDYEQNRPVITIEMPGIKRVAVRNDSIWIDLGAEVLVREIKWRKINDDRLLADPASWKEKTDKMPFDEISKPAYTGNIFNNFSLQKTKMISLLENNVIVWGVANNNDYFVRISDNKMGSAFNANTTAFQDGQLEAASKILALLPDGSFAMGRWGAGLLLFNNDFPMAQLTHWFNSTEVQGLVAAPDYSGYIFSYPSECKYGLGFINNSGVSSCVKSEKASSPVAIITRPNETGNWEIYAAWKSTAKNDSIDFYFTPQNNFSPTLQKSWTLPFESPIDFAFDREGVLWAVSSVKIFYLDKSDNEWKEPNYIRGFKGSAISGLETDARNGLWISTLGDGAYSFTQRTPDTLIAKQYKIKDGLLSELVYDIAIDTIKGKVYFAHDLGLSVYHTPLVRNAAGYMQDGARKPIAYPNPFRPGTHDKVRIDFVNEKSSVYILDSSGKRVRLFKGTDLIGGAAIWDGKNESGKLVAPGLYYYIAADGKNTAKGKILVER